MPHPWIIAALAATLPAALTLAQPQYTVDPIEAPDGFALYPSAINNHGVVVGWWYGSPVTNRQPFIYSQSSGYTLLPKPAGHQFSVPMDINDAGVIVGFAAPSWEAYDPQGWRLESGAGGFTMFPMQTHAVGVNESGLIAGMACKDAFDGSMDCVFLSTQPPAMQTIPAAGGFGGSMDRGIVINDLGQSAYRTGPTTAVFRDAGGATTPLPPPPAGWTGIVVDGINNNGQVIAHWTRSSGLTGSIRRYSRGFVWTAAGGAQEFGITAGSVRPQGINDHGQVIIESGTHDQAFFDCWVWSAATGPLNLDNKTDYGDNLVLTDLYAINNAGQIVAGGDTISPNGDIYLVLNPTGPVTPPCPADLGSAGGVAGGDGALDNNDFVVFIDFFFAGNAAADRGGQGGAAGPDGAFDNNDFVVFIDEFFGGC
ncbi:MAG TPA: GC-type dockerin domain-anchored protein [Phycisphaerales bacterium]|nr:GC-type dockerin domain-anchored protein [Phycisphaerales bacterium]